MPDLSELFLYTGELNLVFIVWPIFIGVCIAAFVTVFVRVKLGEVVRAIIEKGAISPETALTLEELGVAKRFFVRSALRGRSALRRVVYATDGSVITSGDGENTELRVLTINEAPDLDECRFFISDENKARAESIYDNTNSTLLSAIITVLVAFVVAIVSMLVVPKIIDLLESTWDGFGSK